MSKYKYPTDILCFMRERLELSLFHVQDSTHDLARMISDSDIKDTKDVVKFDKSLERARKYLYEALNNLGSMMSDERLILEKKRAIYK